jgi:hypothetical protein
MNTTSETLIAGYGPLAKFLTGKGYPITQSTLEKLCSPGINKGPERLGRWGKQGMFSPSQSLEWARARAGINEHAA